MDETTELGWGGMPLHAVKQDLLEGRLAKLSVEELPEESLILPMSVVYFTAKPPGPAGRWLIERLKVTTLENSACA